MERDSDGDPVGDHRLRFKVRLQHQQHLADDLMTTLIIPSASWNAYKRDPNPQGQFWNSLVTLIIGTYLILEVLILAGGIKTIPSQIIPITGMIVSNGMVAMGFCLKTMHTSFHDLRGGLRLPNEQHDGYDHWVPADDVHVRHERFNPVRLRTRIIPNPVPFPRKRLCCW